MDKEGKFAIYCIERYRQIKGLSGKDVITLFNKYGILDFIRQFFDLLHINGDEAIIQEIDAYIAEQDAGKPQLKGENNAI